MDNGMKKGTGFFNPVWLAVSTVAPQALLLVLSFRQYIVVRAILSVEVNAWAIALWAAMLVLATASAAYSIFCIFARRPLDPRIVVPLLGAYVPLLYIVSYLLLTFSWRTVPQWMFSSVQFLLLVLGFALPCIVYGLVLAVKWQLGRPGKKRAWLSFLLALLIPAGCYLFFMVIMPAIKWGVSTDLAMHSIAILCILGAVLFFFLLLRGSFLLVSRAQTRILSHEIAFRIVLSLVLPLLGLFIYNFSSSLLGGFLWMGSALGDLSSPWYFVIAALGGIFVALPNPTDKRLRIALFCARCAFLPFSMYFSFIILPYTPLALLLIVFAGLGVLVLSPFGLLFVHGVQLVRDIKALRGAFPRVVPVLLGVLAAFIIPAGVTADYLHQRQALGAALRYVYEPDYSKTQTCPVDRGEIARILARVEAEKNVGGTPLLSPYYRLVVLDNMTLSDARLAELGSLFRGRTTDGSTMDEPATTRADQGTRLSGLTTGSRYDAEMRCWVSSVDLTVTGGAQSRAEYVTNIRLPEDAYIRGYYLYIGDRKEEGLVVEKRAALWVYQQIKRRAQDPGVLFYEDDGTVSLKVFPFAAGETRRTGFEILHKEPFTLRIDGMQRRLGSDMVEPTIPVEIGTGSGVYYVSSEAKRLLPAAHREPYYHFVLDCSEAAAGFFTRYRSLIAGFIEAGHIGVVHAKVTLANMSMTTTDFADDWEAERPRPGGPFFLDRALRKILFDHYVQGGPCYPVIVIVTPDLFAGVRPGDMSDFAFTCPETQYYLHLDLAGVQRSYSLGGARLSAGPLREKPVVVWMAGEGSVFLPLDGGASIVSQPGIKALPTAAAPVRDGWETGASLAAQWRRSVLHPSDAGDVYARVFAGSVASGLLTPAVSFMVVENDAQKKMLEEKQDQALAGGISKDLGEEDMEMSEPGLPIMLACVAAAGLLFLIRRKRKSSRA
jgi:hypothetical protein